jgi:signal peptidase I
MTHAQPNEAISDDRIKRWRRPWWAPLRDFAVIVLIASVATVTIKTFAYRGFVVPSESMFPTLMAGDRIGVELISPHFRDYARGQVVVFRDPADWLGDGEDPGGLPNVLQLLGIVPESTGYIVKRIIGLPGETVEGLADGTLIVNGTSLDDPYAVRTPQTPFSTTLGDDEYFMMGDNRANSGDSRFHGAVEEEDLVGPVSFIFFPMDRLGTLAR